MSNIIIKKSEFQKLYDLACDSWKSIFDTKLKFKDPSENMEFKEDFLEEMKSACTLEQRKVFNVIFKDYIKKELLYDITTYKEVCEKLNRVELTLKDFEFLSKEQAEKSLAFHMLKNIEELFNGDWKIDFEDKNKSKWFPYFEYRDGGLVFLCSCYLGYGFAGGVAFFRNRETSDHIGHNFRYIYEKLLNK